MTAPRAQADAAAAPLRVLQLSLVPDPLARAPEDLLQAWETLPRVAEAATGAGCEVSVLQLGARRAEFARNGVRYHFGPWSDGGGAPPDEAGLAALLAALRPQVLHLHGLDYLHELPHWRRRCPGLSILVQDHANAPASRRRPWRWLRQRRALALAQAVVFCAREQARPWAERGLLPRGLPVLEVAESSSDFRPADREAARARTGLHGHPALLWVAHLDANKDPLTLLDAVAPLAARWPGLRLWMCFGQAPLGEAVRRRVQGDPRLAGRVHLVGRVPHPDVADWMSAADLFVACSHREGSGYALMEALACGLAPVVTDIPSHRMLTGRGAVGEGFAPGRPQDMTRALLRAWSADADVAARRDAVRAHFERHLAPAALGRRLVAAYRSVLRAD